MPPKAMIRPLMRKKPPVPKLDRDQKLAISIGKAAEVAFTRTLASLTDDLYNAAVLQNPIAFATTQPRATNFVVTDTSAKLAYKNEHLVPCVVVVRADGDVTELLGSNAEFTETQAQVRGQNQIAAVLWPRQPLYVCVRSPAFPGPTLNVTVTVIPLRGKATVFSGESRGQ